MDNRSFSDSVKLEIIKNNLEKFNGEIHCEICNNKIFSINDCHFDHIMPYAKGGKSDLSNCQILCKECNLKKNDKELKEFILEEKAKQFLEGKLMYNEEKSLKNEKTIENNEMMTKEKFDLQIADFIKKRGDIHKVDFGRVYNHLPSIHYVRKYYGDLNNLKINFGIKDLSYNWNRTTIKNAVHDFILKNGVILQKDLIKSNNLPSLPCILKYYPEFKNFNDIKRGLFNIEVKDQWTTDTAIAAGKNFLTTHNKITLKDLKGSNHLPTGKVIYRLFGSINGYQVAIGSEISHSNEFISKEEINKLVENYFNGKKRIIESKIAFFEKFPVSQSTIYKRYGTFDYFCKEQGIEVLKSKKYKYSKREVDDSISKWVKEGHNIPRAKELAKLGLPSQSVILKFYEDWKDPFYYYKKLYEELSRN